MRGDDEQQEGMFSYLSPEKRIPADHPLRPMRKIVDEILKVMSPKFQKLYSVLLDDLPDYFFSDLRSPNSLFATNAPEDFAVGELRYRQPVMNGVLYPNWHWDRTDVPAFSYQVNDCPMIFAALDVVKR